MPTSLQDALPYILIAILLALVALWIVWRASRRTKVIDRTTTDVLDEGAAPAARNQALIDAAPATAAAPIPQTAPEPASTAAASPATPPAAPPAPTPASEGDDLTRIKGLGPKIVAILAQQGVTRFDQIAAWDAQDVARIDATLGRFAGRISRDQWVEQAKLLATGDKDAFFNRFGRQS